MPAGPGCTARIDYEYERKGTCNLFMMCEPLRGWRHVRVTERRTWRDWAECIKELVDAHYPEAETINLVMDNLNTHSGASLYETFPPEEARRLLDRLEIHPTPKHGSWLDMAEIELRIMNRQCLDRRLDEAAVVRREVGIWTMCHVGIHGQECLFSRGLGSIGANYETDPFVRGTAVSLLGALKWIVPRRTGCYRVLSAIRHQQYGWRHSRRSGRCGAMIGMPCQGPGGRQRSERRRQADGPEARDPTDASQEAA